MAFEVGGRAEQAWDRAEADPAPAVVADDSLIECHECGMVYPAPTDLPDGAKAKCGRCGYTLFQSRPHAVDRALMLNLAALIFFILANVYPFITFKLQGREQVSTLITGVIEFINQDLWILAIVVFGATILFPAAKILSTIYVLASVKLNQPQPGLKKVFRYVEIMHPWAMVEVYLLGVLVAIVKLSSMAKLEFGVGLYAFVALILTMIAAEAALEPREIWQRLDRLLGRPGPRPQVIEHIKDKLHQLGCHACGLVSWLLPGRGHGEPACPRCGVHMHHRKPDSLARSWALLITATILYIPANTYPVMTVISFGKGEPDTILSGCKTLIEAGMWPLALLVFFASITVPVLKIVGLAYLLISVQRKSKWRPRDRTVLYRVVEAVGRWSMIDVFMISILIALVKLGSIATIEPGVGATSFAAVVVFTMVAAMAFDPRLIWDSMEEEHEPRSEP